MKLGTQYRFEASAISREIDTKTRTVQLSFSSEEPVERIWGREILIHGDGVNLKRLNSRAPLLFNHRTDDVVGVIERAWVGDDRRGHALVRFAKNDRGEEVFEMVQDSILSNVSMAYMIHDGEEDKKTNTFRITDWEPMETSVVTVPADITVGIGRDFADSEKEVHFRTINEPATTAETEGTNMSTEPSATAGDVAENAAQANAKQQPANVRHVVIDEKAKSTMDFERARIRAIENLCKMNKLDDKYRDYYVGAGLSLEDISEDILKILEERGKTNPQPASRIGLTTPEAQRFSLQRAIKATADNDWKHASFELECSRSVAQKLGRMNEPNKFFIPFEVLERQVPNQQQQRDLTVATAGAGGYLVSTDNVGFIEMLRNRSVAFRMGARRLSGLQGNVTIPRQSAAATAFWLSTEATAITESQQTFVQVALTPKTVGAYTEISRLLLLQSSPAAEGIVTDDLAQVVATAVDLAVLNGSGASGQPTGIIGTSGVGAVTGTSLAYPGILEFQTDVATANVTPVRGGYVTTPAVVALLMARVKFASTASPLWEGNIWDGTMAGFPGMSSNQMPAAAMLFGDWSEVVVAEWGVLEVEVNPYANFPAGIIGVRAMYSMDVGVRRPFAFSAAATIT